MEMLVTSDRTALNEISTDTRTGSPTRTNPARGIELAGIRPPNHRPAATKTSTGNRIDPNAPIGSRIKILISSQVSLNSPRNITGDSQCSALGIGNLGLAPLPDGRDSV